MNSVINYLRKPYDFIIRRVPISSESTSQCIISPSQEKAKRTNVFNSILSPFETYVVSLQSLLIWERPFLSAGAFVSINIVYWLIVSWNRRFFSILSVFLLLIFGYRTWVYQIWPEIRVPPPEGEDTENWIALNPDVLSVPELSRYLNDFCEKMLILWKDVWKLRKENHGLFCALMCGFFSLLALIGRLIPGVLILYTLVLLLSLGPGVALHLIPSTLYDQMVGYFAESDGQASSDASKCGGSSDKDSDIEEFMPEASAEVLRQLSLKDDVPEVPSPGMVLTDSISDAGEFGNDTNFNESDELYQGLGAFPSVEEEGESDLEDEISDDIVPSIEPEIAGMHFVSSHFKEDSSDSESDGVFTEGLSFNQTQDQVVSSKNGKRENEGTARSNAPKPKISSSSDLDDELMDFEILEESDVLS